jgi:hypothetical protein
MSNLSSNNHPVNIPLGNENKTVSEGFLLSSVISSFASAAADVSEPGRLCDHRAETPRRYGLEESDHFSTFRYNSLFDECDRRSEQAHLKNRDIVKRLLRERMGVSGSPYLEYNAQTRGDLEEREFNREIFDLKYAENVVSQCGKSVVWFEGAESGNKYVKQVHCRKQYCPVCGGTDGKIHKNRMHSILSRLDVTEYAIRQLIFTIPADLRDKCRFRGILSWLISEVKKIIERYFGDPQFDKFGHIKKYKLKKGAIQYLHIFGDKELGVFKPHINVHIFEEKGVKLKLDESKLAAIKSAWLKVLRELGDDLMSVDVHYSFSIGNKKNIHRVKYMSRPWSSEHYEAVDDDSLKKLLLFDLSGFQYMRFWGSMSNCRYRDEMKLSEIVESCGNKAGEKLITLFFAPFDFGAWAYCLERLDDGFFRIKKKGNKAIASPE